MLALALSLMSLMLTADSHAAGGTVALTFRCVDTLKGDNSAIGFASLSKKAEGKNSARAGVSLQVRNAEGHLVGRELSGDYISVPEGYVFSVLWDKRAKRKNLIHVHPADATTFPGISGTHRCDLDLKLE
jgi:hypothetical protein